MARDRKRAKQRQRRAQRAGSRAAVTPQAVEPRAARADEPVVDDEVAAPDPLEHASAETELAEVAARVGLPGDSPDDEPGEVYEDEVTPAEEELGEEAAIRPADRTARRQPTVGGEAPRTGGNRFVNFLRACVVELGRVQWPDRRAVSQATGVVLGFVIIAGAYLGLLDAIWSRVVSAIL